ncbi:MAG: DUF4418 family protein [Faecousia sp.]
MKTKLSNILIAIQALAATCMLGAVKIWAPVCGKMLELASGKEVHMKCFYAGQAATGIAIILLATAIMALIAKKGHKGLMVVSAVAAVILFLTFTNLIGVCASETMRCQTTKLWGIGVAVAIFATSLVELISGKEGQVPG